MVPTLHIQLLGHCLLRADATPITTLDSPRLQALLAYLLLHRETPDPRQHLAFLLWPATTESQAHSNLRTLLHRLRRALPEADHFLHVEAQTVQWRADASFKLDVADFERAAALAERAGDQAERRTALQAAVEVYRGDLLPGCYDDWLLPERERLRQKFLEVLERLTFLLEQDHDYPAAINGAQRLLRQDPLHEATYRQLMRLYALSGDRASALRVYQTYVTVLERELGVAPSPATRAAYEEVLRVETPVDPPVGHPPPPSPGTRRHNLPIPLTSFVGRARELAEVRRRLSTTRLLTLTGAGGCGKSRLALTVSTDLVSDYPDGVWLVELAALTDPALVLQAAATVLGVREEERRPLTATLVDALQPRAMLLVLDNCEHLVEACAHLSQTLLSACPKLQILATSREALDVLGETVLLVPPLSLPEPRRLASTEHLTRSEAIQLFVQRAGAALPTFTLTPANAPAVAEVCQRLDGIPLAIELAAARVKVLAPEQIAERLAERDYIRLLAGGSRTRLPRHQTMQAALDWSHDLLSALERALFRRLAAFAGGWTLAAAEAVCSDPDAGGGTIVTPEGQRREAAFVLHRPDVLELLAHLVDKSLVVVEMQPDVGARYRLLEVIREYARGKLSAPDEADRVRDRHLDFFLKLGEEATQKSRGSDPGAWLGQLETDLDNLRAALEWSRESGQAAAGLRLAGALWFFWFARGHFSEGRERLLEVLARPAAAERTAARANALNAAGVLQALQGQHLESRRLFEEALAIGRELADKPIMATALRHWGTLAYGQVDYAAACSLHEEGLALWRELGSKWDIGWSLCFLADAVMGQGDDQRAQALYEQSITLLREIRGNIILTYALRRLGYARLRQGDTESAAALCRESLVLGWETNGKPAVAGALVGLAGVAAARGPTADAALRYEYPRHSAQLLGAAEALLHAIGSPLMFADRAAYDHTLAAARAQLDEAAFAASRVTGRAMPLDQAVADALRGADGLVARAPESPLSN